MDTGKNKKLVKDLEVIVISGGSSKKKEKQDKELNTIWSILMFIVAVFVLYVSFTLFNEIVTKEGFVCQVIDLLSRR